MASPWVPRVLLGVALAGLIGAIISISVGSGGPEKIVISGGDQTRPKLDAADALRPSIAGIAAAEAARKRRRLTGMNLLISATPVSSDNVRQFHLPPAASSRESSA